MTSPYRRGLARRRVAGEEDAGAGIRAPVAEDHRLDGHGRAQVIGDALALAVRAGPVAVPGAEDRLDRAPELQPGVLGRIGPDDVAEHRLEPALAVGGEPRVRRSGPRGPPPSPSLSPRLRIVSIMPGIETGAPDRTLTRSGSAGSPNRRPTRSSMRAMCVRSSPSRPSGQPLARYALQAAVVIVNAGGTGSPSSWP